MQSKFRAYDKKNKKFILTGFHVVGEVTIFAILDQYRLEEALDLEVTQFAEIQDANKKDIYQEDLVRDTSTNIIGKVVFGNYCIGKDSWGVEHKTPCFCVEFKDESGYCGLSEEWEIVGNSYEGIWK